MQLTWSLFPKFYRHLPPPELAAVVREVGLDTSNLVVRDGYWVTHVHLATELPAFMQAMRAEGLNVRFATTDFTPATLLSEPDLLSRLAENGIAEFRMAHFPDKGGDVRTALAAARLDLERLAPRCERAGIRCVYQLHHRTLIASPSAAYHVFADLPARWMGIEIDPGNQSFDGQEDWSRSARLLGEYLVAVGIKDSMVMRDMGRMGEPHKGWSRSWVPIDDGVTNWHAVIRALQEIDFSGTFVFMPFYDPDNPDTMTHKLQREVAYLRDIVAEVENE